MPQVLPTASVELRDVKSTVRDLVQEGQIETLLGVLRSTKGTLLCFFSSRYNKDVLVMVRDTDVSSVLTQVFEVL